MPDAAETAGAVDAGGFNELLVDTGQSGNVDDGAEAQALPDARNDIEGSEPLWTFHKADGFAAEGLDGKVDDAAVGMCKENLHGDDDHHRDEVRGIGNGLNGSLKAYAPHLIEH